MATTRTDDKLDKNITRLLMQSPLGLTIGDITAAAKCTPQTARKSLARIGAEKDASGMLYVLRDDDEQAEPAPEPAPDVPAPEQAAPDPAPAAVAEVPEPAAQPEQAPANVAGPLTDLQQRILSLLGQHRGLTAQRIAEDLHEPLDGVQDALNDLSHLVTSRPLALPEIQVWEVVA